MNRAAPRLVVSVHDVAPATAQASAQWVADLDARCIPASLLVVPGPWRGATLEGDGAFGAWLHACRFRGHEVCLHGWEHVAPADVPLARAAVGNLAARGCAEFWSLDETEAAQRVRWGLAVLSEHDLPVVGFTPPGWLLSAAAKRGVRSAGLRYVTTHRSVTDLVDGRQVRSTVLCHRPGGTGERAGAALMSHGPGRLARPGRTVRVALHPDDLLRPGLRQAALDGIDAALRAGAVPVTYQALLGLDPARVAGIHQ